MSINNKNISLHATKIGAISLLIWALGPLVNSHLVSMPVFEILTVSFGIGFLIGCLRYSKGGQKTRQLRRYWLIGFIGICGNEILFVSAFKYAPASHIILINFLWPIMVVSLTSIFRNERFSLRYLLAALLGFASASIVLLKDYGLIILEKYWIGYSFVLLGTCLWSIYTLMNKNREVMPSENIPQYCALGFIVCLSLHIWNETFYFPTSSEIVALCWLGIMGLYVAFHLWDFGVKYGNIRVLSVLSYSNVLLSTFFLVLFSEVQYKMTFLIAAIGIASASYIIIKDIKKNFANI